MLSAMECATALDWYHLCTGHVCDELYLARGRTCCTANGLNHRERSCCHLLVGFLAHLAWFGVLQKHGCCCFVLCCCLGQPNLLVTAILSVVFGILALISVIDAFSYSIPGALLVLVLIAAVFVVIHAVTLIYVGFEAFMIWRLYLGNDGNGATSSDKGTAANTGNETTVGEVSVVGAAQKVGVPVADTEAPEATTNVIV